jgi:hypothetical protein
MQWGGGGGTKPSLLLLLCMSSDEKDEHSYCTEMRAHTGKDAAVLAGQLGQSLGTPAPHS